MDLIRPQNFEVSSHGLVSLPSRAGDNTILGSENILVYKIRLAAGNIVKFAYQKPMIRNTTDSMSLHKGIAMAMDPS